MTEWDIQFLKKMGIDPCSLGDPSPDPLPSPPTVKASVPKLAEGDSRWLQELRVSWENEPEPYSVPPKTLPEYLSRYPTGIRAAVGEVAKEMELALSDGDLDSLAQDIVQMFLDFLAGDLEDVVALYEFHRSLRPGGFSFPDYMKFRVKACVETVLELDPHTGRNRGESL